MFSAKTQFQGYDIKFKHEDGQEYALEIERLLVGTDVGSCIPSVKIYFNIDTSHFQKLTKKHKGTLTIINKGSSGFSPIEIIRVELESVQQNFKQVRRESGFTKKVPTKNAVMYMCTESVKLVNARVGGLWKNKKLEDVVREIYQKTGCKLPLKMDKVDNTKQYEQIFIPESSFIDACRHLNNKYGLYNDMFIMFGNSWISSVTGTPEWRLSSLNNMKGETITVHYVPDEHQGFTQRIQSKNYYTYVPIEVPNVFSQVEHKIPKTMKCLSCDGDKLYNTKDVKFADTLRKLKFLKNVDQFENKLYRDTQVVTGARKDMADYAVNDLVSKLGVSAIKPITFDVPQPFILSHWKIGNIVNYQTHHAIYIPADIKFAILGALYVFMQSEKGGSGGGGANWKSTVTVRLAAASVADPKSSEKSCSPSSPSKPSPT